MSDFEATERRVMATAQRVPEYPVQSVILVQLIKHIATDIHDCANVKLRNYNINNTDYLILMMLYGSESGIISPSQLSKATGEKGANITRICNELYDKRLINRVQSSSDRRKVELSLTKKGLNLVEEFIPKTSVILNTIMQDLDNQEKQDLERLLKKILANTKRLEA